jgi:hypothetical protein
MFACVVSGALVQTNFQQIDPTKLMLEIQMPRGGESNIRHLCVFMTGQTPLPEDAAAGIHVSWAPNFDTFIPVGYLSNHKPSAIFKVSLPAGNDTAVARVGISLEPAQNAIVREQQKIQNSTNQIKELGTRIAQHFYNYVASFAGSAQGLPMALLDKWYSNFQSKLQADPNFLTSKPL